MIQFKGYENERGGKPMRIYVFAIYLGLEHDDVLDCMDSVT